MGGAGVARVVSLGQQIDRGMTVATDGVIYQGAYLAPLEPDSEAVLIPTIGGG